MPLTKHNLVRGASQVVLKPFESDCSCWMLIRTTKNNVAELYNMRPFNFLCCNFPYLSKGVEYKKIHRLETGSYIYVTFVEVLCGRASTSLSKIKPDIKSGPPPISSSN